MSEWLELQCLFKNKLSNISRKILLLKYFSKLDKLYVPRVKLKDRGVSRIVCKIEYKFKSPRKIHGRTNEEELKTLKFDQLSLNLLPCILVYRLDISEIKF